MHFWFAHDLGFFISYLNTEYAKNTGYITGYDFR